MREMRMRGDKEYQRNKKEKKKKRKRGEGCGRQHNVLLRREAFKCLAQVFNTAGLSKGAKTIISVQANHNT